MNLGWGGGEAAAEHLTSGMLHLHGQLKLECLNSKSISEFRVGSRGVVQGVRTPPPPPFDRNSL